MIARIPLYHTMQRTFNYSYQSPLLLFQTRRMPRLTPVTRKAAVAISLIIIAFSHGNFQEIDEIHHQFHDPRYDFRPENTPNVDTLSLHRGSHEILSSPNIPCWVKHYVEWHGQQREKYFEDRRNNRVSDVRFLISRCFTLDRCGGASDRLQSMPLNFMIASQTMRVLLIKWERPAPLETFLIPPDGGINWTIPVGMFDEGQDLGLRKQETGEDKIVTIIRRFDVGQVFNEYETNQLGYRM